MHSMRVSKFHRLVSAALSASLLAVTCQTTMAQEPRPVERSIQWRLSGPGNNGDGHARWRIARTASGNRRKARARSLALEFYSPSSHQGLPTS